MCEYFFSVASRCFVASSLITGSQNPAETSPTRQADVCNKLHLWCCVTVWPSQTIHPQCDLGQWDNVNFKKHYHFVMLQCNSRGVSLCKCGITKWLKYGTRQIQPEKNQISHSVLRHINVLYISLYSGFHTPRFFKYHNFWWLKWLNLKNKGRKGHNWKQLRQLWQ